VLIKLSVRPFTFEGRCGDIEGSVLLVLLVAVILASILQKLEMQ
jgi:hypothetical protein